MTNQRMIQILQEARGLVERGFEITTAIHLSSVGHKEEEAALSMVRRYLPISGRIDVLALFDRAIQKVKEGR